MIRRRVVVTGIGVVTALGSDIAGIWNAVCGECGPCRQAFDDSSRSQIADFDPGTYIDLEPRILRRMDRCVQLAMAAAASAVQSSGLDWQKVDTTRCGAVIGSALGGLRTIERQHERLREQGPGRVSAFFVPSLMINAAAGSVAVHWQLNGPSMGVCAGGTSSHHAIGTAFRMIRSGASDVFICGGSEAPWGADSGNSLTTNPFSAGKSNPDQASADPNHPRRPIAEGAGMLVLECLDSALERGAHILAEIAGHGGSFLDCHVAATSDSARRAQIAGPAQAMQAALRDAQLTPREIDHVNVTAAGSTRGDDAERNAVKALFGEENSRVSLSGIKRYLGDLAGAAGAVESILCLEALRTGRFPLLAGAVASAEQKQRVNSAEAERHNRIQSVMNNSFSPGGHNMSLIFRKFPQR